MRAFVRAACRQVWPEPADKEAIDRLELALAEAATNIILHGYQGQKDQPLELIVEADAEQTGVTLLHSGRTFDPQSAPPPVFDGSREGGFGLYLIRQSVEQVQYFGDEQGRNGVRLVKKRQRIPRGEDTMEPVVEKSGDVTVVTVNTEQLDASNAEDFRRFLAPVLQESSKLVLDLGRVQFVDSRGCGAILSGLKHVSAAGGDLKLCHINGPVRTVFELIRLHRICDLFNTREEAVRAFKGKSPG
jgi:anti-sigma B factor antagonist